MNKQKNNRRSLEALDEIESWRLAYRFAIIGQDIYKRIIDKAAHEGAEIDINEITSLPAAFIQACHITAEQDFGKIKAEDFLASHAGKLAAEMTEDLDNFLGELLLEEKPKKPH